MAVSQYIVMNRMVSTIFCFCMDFAYKLSSNKWYLFIGYQPIFEKELIIGQDFVI